LAADGEPSGLSIGRAAPASVPGGPLVEAPRLNKLPPLSQVHIPRPADPRSSKMIGRFVRGKLADQAFGNGLPERASERVVNWAKLATYGAFAGPAEREHSRPRAATRSSARG